MTTLIINDLDEFNRLVGTYIQTFDSDSIQVKSELIRILDLVHKTLAMDADLLYRYSCTGAGDFSDGQQDLEGAWEILKEHLGSQLEIEGEPLVALPWVFAAVLFDEQGRQIYFGYHWPVDGLKKHGLVVEDVLPFTTG